MVSAMTTRNWAVMFSLLSTLVGCFPVTRTVYVYPSASETRTEVEIDSGAPNTPAKETISVGPDAEVEAETFYGALAPYGSWQEVPGVDGLAFRPLESDFAPYRDGRWVHTDQGMTWQGEEPFSWAVYHYGRWIYSDGWAWIPGTEWAPAWVDWRCGNDWAGWAPTPPAGWWTPERSWAFVGFDRLFSPYVGRHLQPRTPRRWRDTRAVPRGARRGRGYSPGPSLAELERRGVRVRRGHAQRRVVEVDRPSRPVVRADRPMPRSEVAVARPGVVGQRLFQTERPRPRVRIDRTFERRLATARTFAEHEQAQAETRWFAASARQRRTARRRPDRGPRIPPANLASVVDQRVGGAPRVRSLPPVARSRWRTRTIRSRRHVPRYEPSPPAPGGSLSVVSPAVPARRTRRLERARPLPVAAETPRAVRLQAPSAVPRATANPDVVRTPGVGATSRAGFARPPRRGRGNLGGRLFVSPPARRRPMVQSRPAVQTPAPRVAVPAVARSPRRAAAMRRPVAPRAMPRTSRAGSAARTARPVVRTSRARPPVPRVRARRATPRRR